MRNLIKRRYKEVLVLTALSVWMLFAWTATLQKHTVELDETVLREQRRAQAMAEDVADSLRRNLHYVAGIPDTFQHAIRVWNAVERFGPDVAATQMSKAQASQAWTAEGKLKDLNDYLNLIQHSLGVDLIFVVNAAGDAIAASNATSQGSPIGTNYADRLWFGDVRQGQRGYQYAMGRTTHKAGLYFATPIMRDGRFLGAIITKVELASLSFLMHQAEAYVVDSNGVIILAHDAEIELSAIPGAAVQRMKDAEKISIYQKTEIPQLPLEIWQHSGVMKRFKNEAFPHVLSKSGLSEYGLDVYVEREITSYFALEREQIGLFLLLSILGSAVILILYSFLVMQRAKNLARESETRMRLILESANSGIWGQSREGACTFINGMAAKMLGYTPDELIGKTLHSIVHHSRPDGSSYPVAECPMNHTNHDGKARMVSDEVLWRKDGNCFEVEYAVSPVISQGVPDGAVVIFSDITERKHQAKLLEQARDHAEAANRAKSDFLANMSHEIRTPMNAVIGFSELAIDSDDEAEKRRFLSQILESSRSLLGILNDILDFSKIEARQMSIENEGFDLVALVSSLDRMFSLRAQEKSLAFHASIATDVPTMLLGDQLRIRQILTNLIGNAIKFTAQGNVSLLVSRIASERGVLLDFCVKDSGIGLSEAQLAGLFQPFSQADNSITRRFGGTGLGLSISRNLAQLMGGDIMVSSELGRGSAFHLQLQLQLADTVQTTQQVLSTGDAAQQTMVSLEGKRVLLVEDNRVNQVLAKSILQKMGMQVDIANHGGESLQKLEEQTYDLVLMDIQMPVMDGLEATRIIRKDGRYSQLPIFAMSAGVTLDEQAMCAEAGMTGFIAKPIDSNALRQKLLAL